MSVNSPHSSEEPLEQYRSNMVRGIFGLKGFEFLQMKDHVCFKEERIEKKVVYSELQKTG